MKVGDRIRVFVPEDGLYREADVVDVPNGEPHDGIRRVLVQLDDGRVFVYADAPLG